MAMTSFILFTFIMMFSSSSTCRSVLGATAWMPQRKSIQKVIEKALLNWFQNSELVARLHEKHIESDQVQHMMKSATFLVEAPDDVKIRFATGWAGRVVSDLMAAEQSMLGDWKVQKVIEAAACSSSSSSPGVAENDSEQRTSYSFHPEKAHRRLLEELQHAPVTLFSFVDCPWCLLAKRLLLDEYGLNNGNGKDDDDYDEYDNSENGDSKVEGERAVKKKRAKKRLIRVVELEDLGREGKELRASIALATGRTSMPACFIGGYSIGGYTDGFSTDLPPLPWYNDDNTNTTSQSRSRSSDLRLAGATGVESMHKSGALRDLLNRFVVVQSHQSKES